MKMYFVSTDTIAQCERMRDKLMFIISELEEKQVYGSKEDWKEIEKDIEKICSRIEKLDNAMNNLVSSGYQLKGYWNDLEVIKAFARERDLLDTMIA